MPAADPGLDGPGGPAAIAAWSDGPAAQCRDGRKFRSEARPTGVEGTRPTVQTTEVEWRVVSSSGKATSLDGNAAAPAPNTRVSGRCFCYRQIPNAATRPQTERVTHRGTCNSAPSQRRPWISAASQGLEPAIATLPEVRRTTARPSTESEPSNEIGAAAISPPIWTASPRRAAKTAETYEPLI